MITINQIATFLESVKDEIPGINKTFLFIDDSHLTSHLRDVSESDNSILVGIIPSHDTQGNDVDTVQYVDYLLFMILNKRDSRNYAETITKLANAQSITKKFVQKLLSDATDDSKPCSFLKKLDANSISIDPIWDLAQCDGYSIELTTKSTIL